MIKFIIILREYLNTKFKNINSDKSNAEKVEYITYNPHNEMPNHFNDYYSFMKNNDNFGIKESGEINDILYNILEHGLIVNVIPYFKKIF